MPHLINFVDDSNGQWAHYNMLAKIRHFAGGFGDLGAVTFAGTGNGTLDDLEASPDAITEIWTLTCTDASTPGEEVFSVTGSVSGAQAAATVGTPYDNGLLSFDLVAGATAFVVADEFEVPVTQGAASAAGIAWDVLRYDTSIANRELILMGHGYSGAEQIYVGFRTYQSETSDYYNLTAAVFTGYVPGNSFQAQPGARLSGVPSHNQRIDYWLTLNPQRIACAMKVGTPVFTSFYTGKFLPYGRPSQYPYPVVCGGMLDGEAAVRFSTGTGNSIPYKGNHPRMGMRSNDGWINPYCYPWGGGNDHPLTGAGTQGSQLRDTDGIYPLLPIELHNNIDGIWGALDGVFFISGFNNAVENTIAGEDAYVIIQDLSRTGFLDYYAMRLDQ